jgi:hypothetical protein
MVDSGTLDSLDFIVGTKAAASSAAGMLILEAALPQDISSASRLFIALSLDGTPVQPETPPGGFISASDLYNWLQANWYIYGRWFITADKVMLYLNAGLATNGTLFVTSASQYVYTALIPAMEEDAYYYVTFTKDGAAISPAFPEDMATTYEDILVWVSQNWQDAGSWHIDGSNLMLTTDTPSDITLTVVVRLPGGFDFGFSDGFDT